MAITEELKYAKCVKRLFSELCCIQMIKKSSDIAANLERNVTQLHKNVELKVKC